MLALIALLTYVLLVRAFRSLLLPLKAVLFNLLSMGATFGVIVLFWQQGLGSELVFGILLDATIVRSMLLPSLVSLMGKWNWYLPDWVARILRVEPSRPVTVPPEPDPARVPIG